MKKVVVLVILVFAAFSVVGFANIDNSLLRSFGAIATEEDSEYAPSIAVLNPYIFGLQVDKITIDQTRYPVEESKDDYNLALVLAYCEYVQNVKNKSVLIVYTNYGITDSFELKKAIDSIRVGNKVFEPGLPILVHSYFRVIDYTDCSCGSREYRVFAVPMPNEFLQAIHNNQSSVTISGDAGSSNWSRKFSFVFHRTPKLLNYINFINGS